MDRIAALRAMLEAAPSNEFARYGLAQEFVKRGDDERALREFSRILKANADYQAAYYHAGKALERIGQTDEARSVYERGVEASYRTGDSHARSELLGALDDLRS